MIWCRKCSTSLDGISTKNDEWTDEAMDGVRQTDKERERITFSANDMFVL